MDYGLDKLYVWIVNNEVVKKYPPTKYVSHTITFKGHLCVDGVRLIFMPTPNTKNNNLISKLGPFFLAGPKLEPKEEKGSTM